MENIHSTSSKVLHRTRLALNQIGDSWTKFVGVQMSRDEAKQVRENIIAHNGKAVIDPQLLAEIKKYSQDTFGSTSYWPWLACYTELRGEFIEGWIPEDYYRLELLPKVNPEKFMRFCEAKTIDHKIFNGSVIEPLFSDPTVSTMTKMEHLKRKRN